MIEEFVKNNKFGRLVLFDTKESNMSNAPYIVGCYFQPGTEGLAVYKMMIYFDELFPGSFVIDETISSTFFMDGSFDCLSYPPKDLDEVLGQAWSRGVGVAENDKERKNFILKYRRDDV